MKGYRKHPPDMVDSGKRKSFFLWKRYSARPGDDHKKSYPGDSLCKLDQVSVPDLFTNMFLEALVIHLGPPGAAAVLDEPGIFFADNPSMGF
jgi:hypothetical protein